MGPVKSSCIFLVLSLTVIIAHESPEHTIHALDQKQNLTPELLHQRALAHRATGKLDLAISDLKAAISQEPKNLGFQLELTRMQLTARQPDAALHTTSHASHLATTADQRASIQLLRAEAYQLQHESQSALDAIQLAFQAIPTGEIEWYLLRSECQRSLKLKQKRISDLKDGLQQHPSAVLKFHWIDALIDAGQYDTALKEIDLELTNRRWKSAYLIKRARALTRLNRNDEMKATLQAALTEIAPRINTQHPDPILLADQGVAYAMLGQKSEALSCLKLLQQHHTPDWILIRLQEATTTK